jgi:hypothetical protein
MTEIHRYDIFQSSTEKIEALIRSKLGEDVIFKVANGFNISSILKDLATRHERDCIYIIENGVSTLLFDKFKMIFVNVHFNTPQKLSFIKEVKILHAKENAKKVRMDAFQSMKNYFAKATN